MELNDWVKNFGRVAYEAYAHDVGNVSVRGDTLSTWDDMLVNNPSVAHAWCVAAMAVVEERG